MSARKNYLTSIVPTLISKLTADHPKAFGLMTPQHMLEHLTYSTKSACKDYGPAPAELTEKQQGFMRFIAKGAKLEHRPSDKTVADLPELKYASIKEAAEQVEVAINRFYSLDQTKKYYHPFFGLLSFEDLELFTHNHFKYHLEEQFGLG